ncbi:IucA/IucC family protein [Legionella spiritensis]|uniref:Siderophore biosynthetic enzyme FrgA n=1 Tax=Legionella spiritensis TaxID=452 RepID=A0A0W0Z6G8_LEGSP|nr:IucA/IucC family protein [Legionella spiritensis]KTD64740.1 siderophore biosynthetic enzyme FrgA [Legionella spiritensis]SNV48140.1 siderophore biosynthetic enzyme FrgA [Legionella spiritensis]
MALAYGNFHELSHHLRFLLFEIGIGLPQSAVEHFITRVHHDCLLRLQQAALTEQLIEHPIASHHAHDFLEQLQAKMAKSRPGSVFYQWQSLQKELNESIANEALALAYRQRWQESILHQAAPFGSMWQWMSQQYNAQETVELLEQWGCTGHPHHPNFRCKSGFSRREIMQYSPEFNAKVAIHWGALRRDRANLTHYSTTYPQLLAEQFPREHRLWAENLRFKQFNPDDYYPLPIHPWQWRNKIQELHSELLDQKELLFVPHHQMTRPTMSFRTMMPEGNNVCHLKLATAVHTTSALRTVSPASVHNGPPLSAWVSGLLAQHDYYRQQLYLAKDMAGINLNHPSIPHHQKNQLALIIRENPLQWITQTQRLVPLAALFAPTPFGGRPLLTEIIDASGVAPEQYFTQYCRCVLTGQLHLMLRYGIALESHQQNTLVCFEDHRPAALVIRDLGGVRICTHALYDDLAKPVFHPDSTITTNHLEDVANKFIHGNLQSNLAHWIRSINQHYGIAGQDLWRIVYKTLKTLLNRLAPETHPAIFQCYRQKLLVQAWQHKSLLSMRLVQGNLPDLFVAASNPLSCFHE